MVDFKDVDNLPVESQLKISTLLPEYIQTRTNRNFMDATFQTLFSTENSESVTGFIGEKPERLFDPDHDFYVPEKSKERQAYQLAPVVTSGDNNNVLYRDIINKLKYQGSFTKNHERLLRQDFYSFSPMIDLNMFVNFNQYFWLEKGPKPVQFFKEITRFNNVSNTITVEDHNLQTNDIVVFLGSTPKEIKTQFEYTSTVIDKDTIKLNGVNFSFLSITDAKLFYRTDFRSFEGLQTKKAFGTVLKNGMVIQTYNDINPDYNGKRFIVEGVGDSIKLVDFDVLLGYDSSPYDTQPYDYDELSFIGDPNNIDYTTIQRGSKNGNVWSMRNRWFHESLLNEQEVTGAFRASRPIVQFNADIELYNFGENYVGDINVVYSGGNIQSLIGNTNTTLEINDVQLVDGDRVVVTNDIDETRNNAVFEVYGQKTGNISLNRIVDLDIGDVVFVTNENKDYYVDNSKTLTEAQTREKSSQNILFNLYDINGIALDDELTYPKSSFTGSQLFSYKTDENAPKDMVLDLRVVKNDRGEIVFENNLDSERYTYELDFADVEIKGSYFFKNDGEFKSHWHKNDIEVNQGIIDEFVSDGEQRIYELSQKPMVRTIKQPISIIVKLNGILLENGVDYIVSDENGISVATTDKYIRLSDTLSISEGDFIKIITYNTQTPEGDFSGFYEVPSLVGLTSNTDNNDILEISRNDVFEHFFSILERQNKFIGDPIGINNSWNIKVNYGRGNKIVQNVAPITKFAMLNKIEETDIIESIKYVEREYRRFQKTFDKKLKEMYLGDFNENNSYKDWVDSAIEDINLGKSSEFPFFNSGMAGYTHIPPSPQYLGILHIHTPQIYLDSSFISPTYVLKQHDGSIDVARSQSYASETFQIDSEINSVQLSSEVNFAWEIMVFVNGYQLEHSNDYTVNNNVVQFNHNYIGEITVEYVTDIIDRVKLYYENIIFSRSFFREYNPYLEVQEIVPGAYRNVSHTKEEFNTLLEKFFNKWCSQRGFNYISNDTFDSNDLKTYNYTGLVASGGEKLFGSWRAIFNYFYDTDSPDSRPWEILGFKEKPIWWDTEYGQAPYTSANIVMWNDIKNGIIKNGPRKGEHDFLKRPNLYIPVDISGNVKTIPEIFETQDPSVSIAKKDWNFGDIGPVEYEWRRSYHFYFSLLKVLFLMKPNMITEVFWEPENNLVVHGNQYINESTLKRFRNSQLQLHDTLDQNDEKIRKYGVQQLIVAYYRSFGKDPKKLENIIKNIDVNLGYGVGGFVDKGSLTMSTDNFGLVPKENIHVQFHNSSSIKQIIASGIILSKSQNGFVISGYDEDNRNIPYYKPIATTQAGVINVGGQQPPIYDWQSDVRYAKGTFINVDNKTYKAEVSHKATSQFSNDIDSWIPVSGAPIIGGLTVNTFSQHEDKLSYMRYDEEITNIQELFNVFAGYQKYLEENGVIFNETDQDTQLNITDFVEIFKDVLIFINEKPEIGETISVSPFANVFKINTHGHLNSLVDFVRGNPTIVSGNGNTINVDDVLVSREDVITITPNISQTQEKMFKIELSFIEKEHLVTFDNITNFNDVIFDDTTNLRQPRMTVFMYRSTDWIGKMNASGFLIDNETITSNFESSTAKFKRYYDLDAFLIGENLNGIAKNAFGFQNKDYYKNFLFDQRDSFQFYLGQLQEKGTNRGLSKILRNDFVRRISNVELNELWAIKTGQYGNLNSYTNMDFKLKSSDIRTNPQVVQFLDSGEDNILNNIIELSPTDDRFLTIRDSNIGDIQFKTGSPQEVMPSAGFLLLSDAKYKVPFLSKFDEELIGITEYDRIWIAENGSNNWDVLRVTNSGETISGFETNGDIIVSDTSSFGVGELVIFDIDGLRKLFTISNIVDSTHIQVSQETGDVSIENPVNIMTTESVAFENISQYNSYTPKKPWTSNDIIFVKDTKTTIDPVSDTTLRKVENQVILDNIADAKIYETLRNTTVAEINIHHPSQGYITYEANVNIDFKTTHDPAKYNSSDSITKKKIWTKDFVGKIWWNLDSTRYIEYDQSSFTYKTNNWGGIFPGTDIEICQWIRSEFPPTQWQAFLETPNGFQNFDINSIPLDVTKFVINREYNPLRGSYQDYYYFWVKNNTLRKGNKTLSTNEIKDIIKNPTKAGIRWFSPINKDALIITNSEDVISDITAMKITFSSDKSTTQHSEWFLFGENTINKSVPPYIFDKVKDSIVGYNEVVGTQNDLNANGISNFLITTYGETLDSGIISVKLPVPDTTIISKPLYGSLQRPRQSWYRDKIMGREAFIASVNKLLKERNWVGSDTNWQDVMYEQDPQPDETHYDFIVDTLFDRDNLVDNVGFNSGAIVLVQTDISLDGRWSLWKYNGTNFELVKSQGFRLPDYWKFVDYYADGFTPNTIQIFKTYNDTIERNTDLVNLNDGDIVKTLDDGNEKFIINQVSINDLGKKSFTLVAKEDATFEFDRFICSCPFSEQAIKSLFESFINVLSTSQTKNRLLIDMIKEAYRQNPVVDWAFQSSLVEILGIEEKLIQSAVNVNDLSENIIDYFNDIKPYHVKPLAISESKFGTNDTANILIEDYDQKDIEIVIDRVSCVADMSLSQDQWTHAERIQSTGKNPEDYIAGCKFRGTEFDSKFFKFFENVVGAGYDVNSYDSTILGYDFNFDDIQTLYDVTINGKEFTDPDGTDVVVNGGNFYQPLLSENRPPEKITLRVGDTTMFDVFTFPVNIDFSFGYDAQPYDSEVNLDGDPAGYDFTPNNTFDFILGPKMIQDLYVADGNKTTFNITQIPQSNDAIFVYVDGLIVDTYSVDWQTDRRPKVIFDNAPQNGKYIKILSFSIGGNSSVVNDKLFDNHTGTLFEMDSIIEPSYTVTAFINGVENTNIQTNSNNQSLTETQVELPDAANGDTVYIVIYQGDQFTQIINEKSVYANAPILLSNIDNTFNTYVYKNGKKLVPSYSRYFDPISPVEKLFMNEDTYFEDGIKVFIDGFENNNFVYDINKNTITLDQPQDNVEIIVLNDAVEEYHFENENLFIHTVALGNNIVGSVPNGSAMFVNLNNIEFERPDNSNSPVNDPNTVFGTFIQSPTNVHLTINGQTLNVFTSDTIDDVIEKIKLLDIVDRVYKDGGALYIENKNKDINLDGNWGNIGIIAGNYKTAMSQIQEALGQSFRVSLPDGKLKIISRDGDEMSITPFGSVDLVSAFGLNQLYGNNTAEINVMSLTNSDNLKIRTEVYQGSVTGQYPITRNGFSDYSTKVSVIGQDKINFSDYELTTIDLGYDSNGYGIEYDYNQRPGIDFEIPHNETETIMITTFNNNEKDSKSAFRILETLNNTIEVYTLSEDTQAILKEDLTQTADYIAVDNDTYLPVPDPSTNTPAFISIEGEIFGYYEIDKSDPSTPKLKNIIRGAKGSVFGYYNDSATKTIKAGSIIQNMSDNKSPLKDASQKVFVTS